MKKVSTILLVLAISTVSLAQRIVVGNAKNITCFDWDESSNLLITGSLDGEVTLWDTKTNSLVWNYKNNLAPLGPLPVRSVSIAKGTAFVLYGYFQGKGSQLPNYERFHFHNEVLEMDKAFPVITRINLTDFSVLSYALAKDKFQLLTEQGLTRESISKIFGKVGLAQHYDGVLHANQLIWMQAGNEDKKTMSQYDLSLLTKKNSYSIDARETVYVDFPIFVDENYEIYKFDAFATGTTKFEVRRHDGGLQLEIESIGGYYNKNGVFYYAQTDGTLNAVNVKSKQHSVLARDFSAQFHDVIYADDSFFILRGDGEESDDYERYKYTLCDVKTSQQKTITQREFDIIYGVRNDGEIFLQDTQTGLVARNAKTDKFLVSFQKQYFFSTLFLDKKGILGFAKNNTRHVFKFERSLLTEATETDNQMDMDDLFNPANPEVIDVFGNELTEEQVSKIKIDKIKKEVAQDYKDMMDGLVPGNMVKEIENDPINGLVFVNRLRSFEVYDVKSQQVRISIKQSSRNTIYQVLNNRMLCLFNREDGAIEFWNLKTGSLDLTLIVYEVVLSGKMSWVAFTNDGRYDFQEGTPEYLNYFDGKQVEALSQITEKRTPGLVQKILSEVK